ncbi:MAG: non-homologous end-joining DNA ligase [Actinobacteria bacterium]|nr:non-homologous end-joining DNA ligase [Actinomycetota bacterium]
MAKTYNEKRKFEETPEPKARSFRGDVDVATATPGTTFMIHQHHARRLHYDLRLEFFNGKTPVLVSWAVPKNLPLKTGKPNLAVHVEDHPFDYGSFSGTIPAGNYGAGEVRIFDRGTYEVLEQEPGKLTIRLDGDRMKGVWHLFQTSKGEEKDWLVRLRQLERPDPDPLPPLDPMKATLIDEPFDDDAWIFEPKWDGVRTLAICDIDKTILMSRNGNEVSATYPEFEKLHDRLVCIDAIVDGEIVAMSKGRPSFERLQSRINLQNERDIQRTMKQIPTTFVAFDLLYLDGRSLLKVPIEERKELLDQLVVVNESVQVSTYIPGQGKALYDAACEQRLEGIVAKKLGCPYRPGRRGREWLKVKTVHDAELVVGGWSRGEGSRSTSFGSLLVGAYAEDGLRFVGSVGTGFSEKTIELLMPRLRELETGEMPFVTDPRKSATGSFGKPIRDPHWIRPELVAKVEFRELTSTGKLRAPSFKGLDPSKPPQDCLFSELEILAGVG